MGNSNVHQLKSDSEPLMIMVSGFDFFPDSLRYESPIEYSERCGSAIRIILHVNYSPLIFLGPSLHLFSDYKKSDYYTKKD